MEGGGVVRTRGSKRDGGRANNLYSLQTPGRYKLSAFLDFCVLYIEIFVDLSCN